MYLTSLVVDVDVDALEGSNVRRSTYEQHAQKVKKHTKGRLTVEFNFTHMKLFVTTHRCLIMKLGILYIRIAAFNIRRLDVYL